MPTIFEGLGKPQILFNDGSYHTLPEPIGQEKDGLRLYAFEQFVRDQYWSEGGRKNRVGLKFIFNANLKWISLPKQSLKKLWRASKEKDITFVLNIDEPTIKYRCECASPTYRFFKGIPNHRAGYTIEWKLTGSELLSTPGYPTALAQEGYGTNYGEDVENQSP